jgi:hypothetical protein
MVALSSQRWNEMMKASFTQAQARVDTLEKQLDGVLAHVPAPVTQALATVRAREQALVVQATGALAQLRGRALDVLGVAQQRDVEALQEQLAHLHDRLDALALDAHKAELAALKPEKGHKKGGKHHA